MHIGLQDWDSEIDMRKLTLAEITLLGTYTYSTADMRATVQKLAEGPSAIFAGLKSGPSITVQPHFKTCIWAKLPRLSYYLFRKRPSGDAWCALCRQRTGHD